MDTTNRNQSQSTPKPKTKTKQTTKPTDNTNNPLSHNQTHNQTTRSHTQTTLSHGVDEAPKKTQKPKGKSKATQSKAIDPLDPPQATTAKSPASNSGGDSKAASKTAPKSASKAKGKSKPKKQATKSKAATKSATPVKGNTASKKVVPIGEGKKTKAKTTTKAEGEGKPKTKTKSKGKTATKAKSQPKTNPKKRSNSTGEYGGVLDLLNRGMEVKQTAIVNLEPFTNLTTELDAVFAPLPDAKYAELLSSIATKGITSPVVVWRGYIVDGHHRVQAAGDLHMTTVPCNHRDDLSRDEAEALYVECNYARRQLSAKEKAKAAAALRLIVERQKGIHSKPVEAPTGDDDFVVTIGDGHSVEDHKQSTKLVKAPSSSKETTGKGKGRVEDKHASNALKTRKSKKGGQGTSNASQAPKVSKTEVTKEAAARLGVGERQFTTLEQAGNAPAPVVDAIGEKGGFNVAEAAKVSKAAKDPRTAPAVNAAVDQYQDAVEGGDQEQIKEAKQEVLKASKKPQKGLAKETPTRTVEDLDPVKERNPETMLEVILDPVKGRITVKDHQHPKSPALVLLNLAPLNDEDPLYIGARFTEALRLAQETIDTHLMG